jgi:DNA polymerase-4
MQKAGVSGQTVTFQVKSTAFQRYSRQTSLEEPTDSADEIEREALYLAKALLTDPDGLFAKGISVRLIGVGVSKLSEKKMQQMNLFDWAAQNQEEEEKEKEREKQLQKQKGRDGEKRKEKEKQKGRHEENRKEREKQKGRHEENRKEKREEKQQQKLEKQLLLDSMLKKINQRYGEGTLGKGMAGHSSEADNN